MTLGVLQLSFRSVYWGDLGNSTTQNAILNTLQLVAKFHEICIIASLSAIVLHRIQFDLNGEGIPFGLLASGYSVSSITYLWSWQFWAGILNNDLRYIYCSRSSLFILLLLVSLLAAVAGPSSAVAIVPRLDWWESRSPVSDSRATYLPNSSTLWPSKLTADVFQGLDCVSSNASQSTYCPSAGWATIAAWDNYSNWRRPFNITMPIAYTNMVRYLAASSDQINERLFRRITRNPDRAVIIRHGYSVASSVGELIARNLGCLYEWSDNQGSLEPMSRPIYTVSRQNREELFKPFVSVQCRDHARDRWKDMQFPHNNLVIPPMDRYTTEKWKVPESLWRPLINSHDSIKASWVDFSAYPGKPSVGLVVFAKDGMANGTAFNAPVLVPCTVDARWVPVNTWIDPKIDNFVHEDQANLLDATYGGDPRPYPHAVSGTRRVSFDQSYIDALAVNVDDGNQSTIEAIIERHFARLVYTIQLDTIASLLSVYIADALARAQSAISGRNIYHAYSETPGDKGGICGSPHQNENLPRNFDFTAPKGTILTYSTLRYGYGWGLKGTPIKLAIVILLLTVAINLVHMISLVHGGWTSCILKTAGEAIALAMNSNQTDILQNTCAGIGKFSTWKRVVKVRETSESHIELVFDDRSDQEDSSVPLMPGKQYGDLRKSRQAS